MDRTDFPADGDCGDIQDRLLRKIVLRAAVRGHNGVKIQRRIGFKSLDHAAGIFRVVRMIPWSSTNGPRETSQTSRPSADEKKLALFRQQKALLDTFLSSGAISQAQYDKSLSGLIEKMGIKHVQ
jgi:hypothetical protein